jgi:hypothetical protein
MWHVRIRTNNKYFHVGRFHTEIAAERAMEQAANLSKAGIK